MSWPAKLSDLYTPGSIPEVRVRSGTPLLEVKVRLHFEHGKDLQNMEKLARRKMAVTSHAPKTAQVRSNLSPVCWSSAGINLEFCLQTDWAHQLNVKSLLG